MSKIVIRTEFWNTKNGKVIKAVARKSDGTLVGATNQTASVDEFMLVGDK
jgi:hypothetical protein